MAIGKDTALRLMLVDDQVNEAEAIVSSLRNAGIAVRPLRPESLDELAQMLGQQTVDLVLAEHASAQMPFKDVATVVMGCGRDVPLLAVLDGITDEILDSVQAQGAHGVALRGRPQQLLKTVRTEWHDLDSRRSQRHLEAQKRETERRCDALIDSSREPIAYIHEGMHIRANQAYLEMFGLDTFDEIEGMSLLDLVASADVDAFKQLLQRLSKGEAPPPRYELTARDVDGNGFPAVMEFTAATYEGEACQQVIFRRQELEQDPELARQVKELKQRDLATGLYNRATFLSALEDAVADAAGKGTSHGLLLIEPDHYAKLLEVIGLDAADELIAAMAQRLEKAGEGAMAARFGDHQLALLMRDSDHLATSALAARVCAAFADHVLEVGDNSLNATVSIGGVQIGERNASTSQVLAKASHGVTSSIGVGGNRFELFDPGAVDRAEEERVAAWVSRLRDALDYDRFLLHYQPVISLQGEPGATYEVYLRLDAGGGETVPPLSFLQIAEEHGLLWEIDRWVIQHAITVAGERLRAGQPTTLLVKVTHASLVDEALPAFIGEQLAAHGVGGAQLVLQIPESKVFTNLRAAQAFAAAVTVHGCRVALEQFGAGLDSFQLLSHFDPAFVKVDRSFMEDLPRQAANQQRIRQIADKARDLGIKSIAEFVQDAASMSILFSSGIDYVEGYFLAGASPDMNYDFS